MWWSPNLSAPYRHFPFVELFQEPCRASGPCLNMSTHLEQDKRGMDELVEAAEMALNVCLPDKNQYSQVPVDVVACRTKTNASLLFFLFSAFAILQENKKWLREATARSSECLHCRAGQARPRYCDRNSQDGQIQHPASDSQLLEGVSWWVKLCASSMYR